MISIIRELFFKKEINKAYKEGFTLGRRAGMIEGRREALQGMVRTGQNQYVCKHCKTPVAQALIDTGLDEEKPTTHIRDGEGKPMSLDETYNEASNRE